MNYVVTILFMTSRLRIEYENAYYRVINHGQLTATYFNLMSKPWVQVLNRALAFHP